jgi:hypothetical protein
MTNKFSIQLTSEKLKNGELLPYPNIVPQGVSKALIEIYISNPENYQWIDTKKGVVGVQDTGFKGLQVVLEDEPINKAYQIINTIDIENNIKKSDEQRKNLINLYESRTYLFNNLMSLVKLNEQSPLRHDVLNILLQSVNKADKRFGALKAGLFLSQNNTEQTFSSVIIYPKVYDNVVNDIFPSAFSEKQVSTDLEKRRFGLMLAIFLLRNTLPYKKAIYTEDIINSK